MMIDEALDKSESTKVSVCNFEGPNDFALLLKSAGNSETLASPSYSYKLTVSMQYKPPPLAKALSSESIGAQSVLAKESGQSKAADVNWFGRLNRRNEQDDQRRLRRSMIWRASDRYSMSTCVNIESNKGWLRNETRSNGFNRNIFVQLIGPHSPSNSIELTMTHKVDFVTHGNRQRYTA
jgi:hypothetical protein